ncbi:MAG: BTAD domain-containing putative transcriptional regulator [Anaerolineae bacterium]
MYVAISSLPRGHDPGSLPAAFVVRRDDSAALKSLLAQHRLITITGLGGVGKTCLARQVAEEVGADFPDGVWHFDLTDVRSVYGLFEALAFPLGILDSSGHTPFDAIAMGVRSWRSLLILDHVEACREACAELCDTLLAQTTEMTLLCVSRESLNIFTEKVYPVSALATPSLNADLAAVEASEAARLFVQRAAQVRYNFHLTLDSAPYVAHICRQLDGFPLAIEVAASRMHLLSLEQVAQQLPRILLLSSPAHRGSRHESLKNALDSSYVLLAPAEQCLLRRLAVFPGGFSLEAAEALRAPDGSDDPMRDLLASLERLVNNGWVTIDSQRGGTVRYNLANIVRQYIHHTLFDVSELAAIRRRHAQFFFDTLKSLATQPSAAEAAAQAYVTTEFENLRAALDFLLEECEADAALEMSVLMARLCQAKEHQALARRWLTKALEMSGHASTPLHAEACRWASHHACYQGDLAEAQRLGELAVGLLEQNRDRSGLAQTMLVLGVTATFAEEHELAVRNYQAALEHFSALDDKRGMYQVFRNLGTLKSDRGEYPEAMAAYESCLNLACDMGEAQAVALALLDAGEIALRQSDNAQASILLERSLAHFSALGLTWGVGLCYKALGRLVLAEGDGRRATRYYQSALQLWQAEGRQGELAASFEGLAHAALKQGSPTRAARLLGAAAALRERTGSPVPPLEREHHERVVDAVRACLGPVDFTDMALAGRAMPLTEVFAFAQAEQMPTWQPAAAQPAAAAHARLPNTSEAVPLRILGLGQSQVFSGTDHLGPESWAYAKPKELLFYLLLHPKATKEQIGLALWPDASPKQVTGRFHSALHQLRLALGCGDWILLDSGAYSFNRARSYWFDLEEFEAAVAPILAHVFDEETHPPLTAPSPSGPAFDAEIHRAHIERLEPALALYTDDLMMDFSTVEWVMQRREHSAQMYNEGLLALAVGYLHLNRPRHAVKLLTTLVQRDPYHELAHTHLMLSLARSGEQVKAIRHYAALEKAWRQELQMDPGAELTALKERIRQGEPV